MEGFRQGLREHGYVEGSNIHIEYRYTDESLSLAPGFAAELASRPVDIIVTTGQEAAIAAKNATSTIPIVGTFLSVDPVRFGLAASLARPGGNVTGLTALAGFLTPKRLQILKELRPETAQVAILWNANAELKQADVAEGLAAAPLLGIALHSVGVRGELDLEGAFRAIAELKPDAVLVLQDPFTAGHSARIVDFVNQQRLPAVYEVRLWTDAGGLMHYGINSVEQFRRTASYVDRVLKGAYPGDLPIEQPDKVELVINLAVAREIGLTVPPTVLAQATQILNWRVGRPRPVGRA
jgi:putative ABC transport system substrate-binding protein